MSLPPVWIVLLSYGLMKGCAGAIQCYACDDCQAVNDTLLQLCPPDAGTLAASPKTTTSQEEDSITSGPETTTPTDAPEPATEAGDEDAVDEAVEETEPVEAEVVEGDESSALVLNITRRKRESPTATYHCFSVQGNDGSRPRTRRGCIEILANASACAILKEKYDSPEKDCRICSEDKCNSGAVLKYSLSMALLAIVNSLSQW